MEVTAHFENIHSALLRYLGESRSSIVAAVAWFTDHDIYDVLCRQAGKGAAISVALIDDDINRGPGRLNFERLRDLGGEVHFVPKGSQDESLMHHKFCVIDEERVITGSYNWSRRARSNEENITVISGHPDMARQYLEAFDQMLERYRAGARQTIDHAGILQRLELIRNMVLLEEIASIGAQVHKLRPIARGTGLEEILRALDRGQFGNALEQIEGFLHRARAMVTADDIQVAQLRLRLASLEFQLEALSNEKEELERRLILFNRRHDAALGELIERLLAARARLARIKAELVSESQEDPELEVDLEEKAEAAEQAYRDYSEQHERLLEEPEPPDLDAEGAMELKDLFRRATRLCHPDKVPDDQKARAHEIFLALQEAYRSNDVEEVRRIFEALRNNEMNLSVRSSVLSVSHQLKAAIVQMEHKVSFVVRELQELRGSAAVLLMKQVGDAEDAWENYVGARTKELEEEYEEISDEIEQH